ncbi:MAG: hypothetical protein IJ086_13505 [Clostridium sp.]|nr:hypothetical protein [Clostridium sp.]MBQ8999685.1 hypothetical protein [Clostridium sp.]
MDYKDNQQDEIIREEISEILDADGRVIENFNDKDKKNKTYIKINSTEYTGIKGMIIKLGVSLLLITIFIIFILGMTFILVPVIVLSFIAILIYKIKNKFRK